MAERCANTSVDQRIIWDGYAETFSAGGDRSGRKRLDGLSDDPHPRRRSGRVEPAGGCCVCRTDLVDGLALIDAMLGYGAYRLVFSSTAAAYGEPETVSICGSHSQKPIDACGQFNGSERRTKRDNLFVGAAGWLVLIGQPVAYWPDWSLKC